MNRVVDEHILPEALFRADKVRLFAKLGAAFTSVFFETEEVFLPAFRKKMLLDLAARLEKRIDLERLIDMTVNPKDLNWHITAPNTQIDLTPLVVAAWERVRQVERANALISSDDEVMGATYVFAGTRVPIETVLASLDAGVDKERLKRAYPFLTDELVEAARIYARVHPKRGRPRRISETHPDWKVKSRRVARPAVKA
jgi:uncharacterized protein (DUF433 family)